jgi:hypothetical protein
LGAGFLETEERASTFEQLCQQRHAAGIQLYRDGDPTRPFHGDPIREAIDETLDLANYAAEAERSGQLSPVSAEHVRRLAETAYSILIRHGRGNDD